MENPIDRIYADYKAGIGPTGTHGVPNPFMDGELEPDVTGTRVCPTCGSMDISFDLSTNETVCKNSNCKKKVETPHRIDFQKEMERIREREAKAMEDAMKAGVTFGNNQQT